jgi:hypothetical protein
VVLPNEVGVSDTISPTVNGKTVSVDLVTGGALYQTAVAALAGTLSRSACPTWVDRLRKTLSVVLALTLAATPAHGLALPTPSPTFTPSPAASDPAAEGRPRRIRLRATWDDGIVYGIGTVRQRPEPGVLPRVFPAYTLISGRAGARLHLDGAGFAASDGVASVASQFDLRRAFVNFGGEIAFQWPVRYYFEFGVLKERPYLDRGWFDVRRPGSDFVFSVGQYYAPLGLDQLTSSNTITFLERAQPVQAFAPGTKAGIQLSHASNEGQVAWAFGGFADTQRTDAADHSDGPTRLVGRVTWVPTALADAQQRRLVHLGLAGEYVLSSSASVRYKATPESSFAPALVVPEPRHGQIEIAVTVEVARTHVGDASDMIRDHMGREALVAIVLQDDDRSDPVVAGREHSERGDDQIKIAVAVEIDRLDVGRCRDRVADRPLREHTLGELANPGDAAADHVADENV